MTEPGWTGRTGGLHVRRLNGLTAAKKARAAVAKLEDLLADLSPREDEHPAWTERSRAWSQLTGAMIRVGLRMDDVIEAETAFKASKRPFNSTVKRPGDPF